MIFALVVLILCVMPMMVGGFSNRPSKAASYAGVAMALLAFVVFPVPGRQPGPMETTFEGLIIQALAVIPVAMALGLIGYGMRRAFGSKWATEPNTF
jgi:protein-S-isoprenylcysteine O-methyltransferase Ste14